MLSDAICRYCFRVLKHVAKAALFFAGPAKHVGEEIASFAFVFGETIEEGSHHLHVVSRCSHGKCGNLVGIQLVMCFAIAMTKRSWLLAIAVEQLVVLIF